MLVRIIVVLITASDLAHAPVISFDSDCAAAPTVSAITSGWR